MTMPSPAPWLDAVLIGWFVLTALSVAYVAWDAFTRNPELRVMKWGWLLVTLYGGPIMAAAYVLSCQEPANERHEDFVRPLWKQAFGSAIHCMAGDATGVIAAAAITTALQSWFQVQNEDGTPNDNVDFGGNMLDAVPRCCSSHTCQSWRFVISQKPCASEKS